MNEEHVEGGPGDTGEVLGLFPTSFQQCGAHKRDISCSFPSSFLSLGHKIATQWLHKVIRGLKMKDQPQQYKDWKTFRETRRGSYFLGITDL